jgi:hypothetical protein
MQRKLHLLIAASSFAALAASGGALAQSSNIPNQPSDMKSTLSNDGSSGDKATNQKQKADSKAQSLQPQTPNSPVSVTPPSGENNNTTSVGANTPAGSANASAGPAGANANVNVAPPAGTDSNTTTKSKKGKNSPLSSNGTDSKATQQLSESSTKLTGSQAPKPEDVARNARAKLGQEKEDFTSNREDRPQ